REGFAEGFERSTRRSLYFSGLWNAWGGCGLGKGFQIANSRGGQAGDGRFALGCGGPELDCRRFSNHRRFTKDGRGFVQDRHGFVRGDRWVVHGFRGLSEALL
ncbi:hypothetical protein, partial [Nocardia cyriacigeorgica]|uniref:hypothetical protein n=1 Tax=Nocardia cyriacigeorgica TaxID=135487 RepID=UPI001C49BD75